ncbi:MAG: acyl-CoA dehydratase activase [Deltaproteobacteria bacterium]|nr:acyl-CoA dehydratase activase [Deltaproteobacteria bacterium]MDO9209171.1 acyl-CoA dehydratase activase [Deltaproteobacteria bacterium]
MIVAGMDIGSITAETVILQDNQMLSSSIVPTGANSRTAAERSLAAALKQASLRQEDLAAIVTTGYGRASFPSATKMITEITCHARGAFFVYPETRTVIDIGGQDSKVIRLDKQGRNVDFQMNDKCAAGTGRFLEVMARALEVKLEDLGRLSRSAQRTIKISSMCTVFAESEVVSLIAENQPQEVIIRGLHDAIADRILGMVRRVGVEEKVTLTGGVAKNEGVVLALEERLGVKVFVPPEPQIIGALGAALLARGLPIRS